MPPKGKKKAYSVAEIDAEGLTLQDLFKNKWKVGEPIGIGGFGKLYKVTCVDSKVDENGFITGTEKTLWCAKSTYVLKLEPATNGPLFTELSFYTRRGKKTLVDAWMKKKKMTMLGMPSYVGSGTCDIKNDKYRFMVMPLYGCDLQKLFMENDRRFPLKTVCGIALQVLDVLEYLHDHEYVHADIKAANLLVDKNDSNQVYLVDFGLAYKFKFDDGKHMEYREDLKRAHDGTIEFTSIDAHLGCRPSQRGDLEILGYCLLQWLCGFLPWENDLTNPDSVRASKICFKKKTKQFIADSLQPKTDVDLKFMTDYMSKIYSMGYEDSANFVDLRSIFKRCLQSNKLGVDGQLLFPSTEVVKKRKSTSKVSTPKRVKQSTAGVASAKKSSARKQAAKTTKLKGRASAKSSNDSSSASPATKQPKIAKAAKNALEAKREVAAKKVAAAKRTASKRPTPSKSTSLGRKRDISKIIPAEASILPSRAGAVSRTKSNGSTSRHAVKERRSNGTQTSPRLKGLKATKKR